MTNSTQQIPSPLPKTLPVGTRAGYIDRPEAIWVATGEWKLGDADTYIGPYKTLTTGKEASRTGGFAAKGIHWSSVPTPEPSKPRFSPGMRVRRTDGLLPGVVMTLLSRKENTACSWFMRMPSDIETWCPETVLEVLPSEPESKPFDYGPFKREDWVSVLAEVTNYDATAVIFLHMNGAILSADSNGRGTAVGYGSQTDIRRRCMPDAFLSNAPELRRARAEGRIFPDDDPSAQDLVVRKTPAGVGPADSSRPPCEYCGGSRALPEQAYQFEYEPGKTLPCCRSCFRQNERTRAKPTPAETRRCATEGCGAELMGKFYNMSICGECALSSATRNGYGQQLRPFKPQRPEQKVEKRNPALLSWPEADDGNPVGGLP